MCLQELEDAGARLQAATDVSASLQQQLQVVPKLEASICRLTEVLIHSYATHCSLSLPDSDGFSHPTMCT
jgi:hypothetical protein